MPPQLNTHTLLRGLAFTLLFTATTAVAQENFEFRTARNTIDYRVPQALTRTASNLYYGTQLHDDDKRIFVAGYARSSLFKETTTAEVYFALLDLPAIAESWEAAKPKVEAHLTHSGEVKVSSWERLHHGIKWTVYEQREIGTGIVRGASGYGELPNHEVIYVGLTLYRPTKFPPEKQQAFLDGIYELISTISVRR